MAKAYLEALQALPNHGPSVEITYENLSHRITVPIADTGITNIARATVDLVAGPFRSKASKYKALDVLTGMTGRIRPGTATLVIGNPGGGKSTLLNFLAGRDKPSVGSVRWNGEVPGEGKDSANAGKIAAVAPQLDVHEPLLFVRETFQFAADSALAPLPADASPAEKELRSKIVDHVIDTLGLRECENVIVGDELRRGVSGGQKKRVTIGEALLTGARVLCLDESTNGLDAATAADICQFLASWSHVTGGTVIAALQAPPPEVFKCFDEVILLSNGFELYHGPTGKLEAYLSSLGFACPDYMDIADYALSLTVSPAFVANEYADLSLQENGTPLPTPSITTREGLAAEWLKRYNATTDKEKAAGGIVLESAGDKAQYGVTFVHSSAKHMGLLVSRQARLVRRNPAISIGRITQFVVLASIFGSIYYKISTDNFVVKYSLAIFAASAVAFASFAEIPTIFISKRTAARQMSAGFYQPLAYVLSVIVNSLPVGILSTFLFGTILYWMTGFADDAGRYFFFVLTLICHELACSAIFRMFAFSMPREELAQAAAGITTGTFLVFGGFYIPYSKIPPFMWPIYYISPFSWTVRSMADSEFTAADYAQPLAPPFVTQAKGDVYLDAFSFARGMDWKWGGVAYLLAIAILAGPILSSLIVYYNRVREQPGSQRIDEASFLAAAAASSNRASSPKQFHAGTTPQVADKAIADAEANMMMVVNPSNPAAKADAIANGISISVNASRSGSSSASSALPFTPATLTFKNIKYAVKLRNKSMKPLLRDISGFARPGTMTALMGASGAGKTTLLDVLAFRKTTGAIEGTIHINGLPVTSSMISRMAGFAEQEDTHADYATVKEAVEFSARLRLPASVKAAQRASFVEEVLDLLELTPIAVRRTGSLAQGERKRLTIGVELAANPPILFLDEPTTGLDARSAAVVMRVIRNIASTGRTVIATIHQPSAEVFFGFDALLCLVPGGYQTFLGPLHAGTGHRRAENLVRFLEGLPGVTPLGHHGVNPATWMLEQMAAISASNTAAAAGAAAAAPVDGKAADSDPSTPVTADAAAIITVTTTPSTAAPAVDVAAYYEASPLAKSNATELETLHAPNDKLTGEATEQNAALAPRPSFGIQLSTLLTRMMLYMWRNSLWNGLRLFVFLFLSLFFGLLYLQIDDSDQAGVFGKIAVALNSLLFVAIINQNTGVPNYARLRAVFYREKAAGFYSALAYPLSLILTELPWTAFFALAFQAINYFLVGFKTSAGAFFTAYLACVLVPWWFAMLGMGFIAFFPVPLLAQIMGGLTIQLSILFAGVNLSVNDLPSGWRWMYYSDGFAHALRLYMLPQYEDDQTLITIFSNGAQVAVPRESFLITRMGTTPDKRWDALGWLVLIVVGAAALASIFYVKINHQKR